MKLDVKLDVPSTRFVMRPNGLFCYNTTSERYETVIAQAAGLDLCLNDCERIGASPPYP